MLGLQSSGLASRSGEASSYGVDTAHAVEPSPQIWVAEMSDKTIPPSMIMPSSNFDWDTPETLPGNEIMT